MMVLLVIKHHYKLLKEWTASVTILIVSMTKKR